MSRVYIILLLLSVTSFSCTNLEDALFEMRVDADFTIPPGLNSFDTHHFIIRDVPTRFRNFVSNPDDVNIGTVRPSQATLSALFVGIDWAIIREISVHVVSDTNPNLSKEVFFNDRINSSQVKDLELLSSLSEVKDILFQDFLTLEVRLNFRRVTSAEVEGRITMNFNVNGPE